MIVPMKKVCVALGAKDAHAAVRQLRRLGVLHIEHQQLPAGGDLASLQEDIALINEAILIIPQKELAQIAPAAATEAFADHRHLARHIIDTQKRIRQLAEYSHSLVELIRYWQAWGDFSPDQINLLKGKGIFVKFYQIPERQLNEVPDDIVVRKVFAAGGVANCLVVGRGESTLPFKEMPLPKLGLSEMRQRLSEDRRVLASLGQQLKGLARFKDTLLEAKKSLQAELKFQQAIRGMGYTQDLAYIAGYIPFDAVDKFRGLAEKESWGFLMLEPSEKDEVPTFIRNPRWIAAINPIFRFLEILPGYRELDISLPFLIFFSIFFGMLIGDAGCGIAYLLITLWIHRRAKATNRATGGFLLFYILSSCAIIWGILTGTFFGHEWLIKAGYRPLVPALNNHKVLQRFCFLLGAGHLSLAHAWQAVLKYPSLIALADAGWICILWAAFFIAKALILGDAFPVFGKWLIIAGVSLVILFASPRKNMLRRIGAGLGTLALSVMNSFTDVVSYVRLFAVGLAGVAIADAFNAMAAMIGRGNVFMILAAAFVALLGNSLGFILGPVSVLVHGVRLNVLEFSGHANVSWSGIAYKPLEE